LHRHPELGIILWQGATVFYGNGNIFSNAGKSLGHPVKARKHLVFPFFKNASHSCVLRLAKLKDLGKSPNQCLSLRIIITGYRGELPVIAIESAFA
jgi:hypothetical protein